MPHADPEVRRTYHRAYNQRNAERLLEQRRSRAASNRDRDRARWEAWCKANPEARRAITERARRKYEQTHPDRIRDKNATRRARVIAVTVERVDRIVVYQRDKGRCGICGRFVSKSSFEVDHRMPLARGGDHSYANCQTSHPTCNRRKTDRLTA